MDAKIHKATFKAPLFFLAGFIDTDGWAYFVIAEGSFSLTMQTNKQLEIRKRLSHKDVLQQLTVIFQTNVEKIYADTIKE